MLASRIYDLESNGELRAILVSYWARQLSILLVEW
jgi:hypothetical protein